MVRIFRSVTSFARLPGKSLFLSRDPFRKAFNRIFQPSDANSCYSDRRERSIGIVAVDRRRCAWTLILNCLLTTSAIGQQTTEPSNESPTPTPIQQGNATAMVAGFERFGRHGEIPQQVAGELLISELNCTACHASDDPLLAPKRGPRLTGAGNRLQADWVRKFLSAPHVQKPGATMPFLIDSIPASQRNEAIDSIAAFLGTQIEPFAEIKAGGASPVVHEFWKHGDASRGERLYHSIGCVACHDPDPEYETVESKPSAIDQLIKQLDPEEIEDLGLVSEARSVPSVPHSDLDHKYTAQSLAMLIFDPAKTRPGSRMPSLRLSPAESADIAAYLLGESPVDPGDITAVQADPSKVLAGKAWFEKLRCAACHDVKGNQSKRQAMSLSKLNPEATQSCLQHNDPSMPRYNLDAQQRTAIRAALTNQTADARTASDEIQLRMLQLNCYGCHRRDLIGGVGRFRKPYFETQGHVDLGDEGKLPPTLTGVGRKLLPKALAGVFHPKTSAYRYYMTARMPTYSAQIVDSLVKKFPVADQVDRSSEIDVFVKPDLERQVGRDLINTGCVGCHSFRGEYLPGVVGIDLKGITNRVHPRWFHDFILNPGEIKQRTRMPTYFPDGKSNRADLLDGDVDRQIAAIWAYLKKIDDEPLPEKIDQARSANYVLAPKESPVVIRTFMEQAGTHAIAVGFPAGAHYAFDSEHLRLAIAWQGRFLDARGTWFERFAPNAEPLGDHVVTFPTGTVLHCDEASTWQFQGYRLDSDRVPTLMYRLGACSLQDTIKAIGPSKLRRTIIAEATESQVDAIWQLHRGQQLKNSGELSFSDAQGLSVTLVEPTSVKPRIIRSDDQSNWQLPMQIKGQVRIVLEYNW